MSKQINTALGLKSSFESNCDHDFLMCFTEDEIHSSVNKLKKVRVTAADLPGNQYIVHSTLVVLNTYCQLFNKVLCQGILPEEWVTGLILREKKGKGDVHDCNDCRGIPLLSCMGQLSKPVTYFLISKQVLGCFIKQQVMLLY